MSKFTIIQKLFFLIALLIPTNLRAEDLFLRNYGHSQFLIQGNDVSILINPFKATGCAVNLKETSNVERDFILASSRLADEGYNPSNSLMFVDPGTYKYKDLIINGISIPHDRFKGRRFGMATVWTWRQSDFKIVHMSGAAGNITFEDQILINRPDILFISIGGGEKSYSGKEAAEIVKIINPKIIIPVHFMKNNKNIEGCEFTNENEFLENSLEYKVKYVGDTFRIKSNRNKNKLIYIFKK